MCHGVRLIWCNDHKTASSFCFRSSYQLLAPILFVVRPGGGDVFVGELQS